MLHHCWLSHLHSSYPPTPPTPLAAQEDINEEPRPRMWWPREIWGRYASSLADLKQPEHAAAAVQCVNHMVRGRYRGGTGAVQGRYRGGAGM